MNKIFGYTMHCGSKEEQERIRNDLKKIAVEEKLKTSKLIIKLIEIYKNYKKEK